MTKIFLLSSLQVFCALLCSVILGFSLAQIGHDTAARSQPSAAVVGEVQK